MLSNFQFAQIVNSKSELQDKIHPQLFHDRADGAEKVEGDGKMGGYSNALARNIFPAMLISNRAPLSSMNSLGFKSLSFPVAGS
jgi:hypothetical protein